MSHGILSTALLALAWGGLTEGCRTAPDPAQVREVEVWITSMEAARLTLNELDPARFDRVDSLYMDHGSIFTARFKDTLDRDGALSLANQYLILRDAGTMGSQHRLVQEEVSTALDRLRSLRVDLMEGALDPEKGGVVLERERDLVQQLEANVDHTISNYRSVQFAWDEQARIDPLLDPVNESITTGP